MPFEGQWCAEALKHLRVESGHFTRGVLESCGVEVTWRPVTPSKCAPDANKSSGASPLSSLLPPPPATDSTGLRSPLQLDTTACPSPVSTPSASSVLTDSAEALPCVEPITATLTIPHISLLPAWTLVEHDPKLWMVLRKSILANAALAVLTLTYTGLSRWLAGTPFLRADNGSRASSLVSSSLTATAETSEGALGHASSSSPSALYWLMLWWVRLGVSLLKYVGQWPFYTILQIIGLVWFSQLYRETWLVRKGWVLRGTQLRETSVSSAKSNTAGDTCAATPSAIKASRVSRPGSPLPRPASESASPPWLTPVVLSECSPRDSGEGQGTAGKPMPSCTLTLLRGVYAYLRHVSALLARLVRSKGPTVPLQEWVIGDASAAAAAAAAVQQANASPAGGPHGSSPDVFTALVLQLEATSEVLFKALATMSFAIFASCVGQLPWIGTPLFLLMNAQLYAFYVFDYRYAAQQQPDTQHQRGSALAYQLHHFERCWTYYAGYGIGSAVLSLWLTRQVGTIVSVCAMSVLYSWQVVWSGFSAPVPSLRPLPLFSLWFYTVDMVQRHFAVLWRLAVVVALLYIPYECARGT